MQRAKLNYIIDVGLLISFLIVFISGVLKLPPALQALGTSLPYSAITPIHDISGIIMGILVVIHLALHWNWIVSMTKSFFAKKDNIKK